MIVAIVKPSFIIENIIATINDAMITGDNSNKIFLLNKKHFDVVSD